MVRRGKVEALILSRRSVGEADRLLTLFTKEYGVLKVMAKGVRKIPSRRGGHIEALTKVLSVITGVPGHYFLAGVETLDAYPALRADQAATAQAWISAQAIMRLFPEEQAHQDIYDAVAHLWELLPQLSRSKRYVLEVAVLSYILRCAGVTPDFSACTVCGTAQPVESVILDGALGGWHCLTCHDGLAGTTYSLSPQLLRGLNWLTRHPRQALALRVADEQAMHLVNATRQYLSAYAAR